MIIETKGMHNVFLWKVFWMQNDDADDSLLFIIGRFSKKIKRVFYRMNHNTKWVQVPYSLVPRNLPLDEITNYKKFGWLGLSPEAIMAKIRKEGS